MNDPRIDDLFKEIERLKTAIIVLAERVDTVLGLEVSHKIWEIIRQKEA